MSTTKTATPTKKDTALIDQINLSLADAYALLGLTHLAHWNVEGQDFFALHKAFEEQYQYLFEAVDEIAERIRAIDGYTIGGLGTLAKTAGLEEFKAPMTQQDYVAALIVAHEKVVDDHAHTRDLGGEVGDLQTQDLFIKQLQWHEKTIWMLKSYLKG